MRSSAARGSTIIMPHHIQIPKNRIRKIVFNTFGFKTMPENSFLGMLEID